MPEEKVITDEHRKQKRVHYETNLLSFKIYSYKGDFQTEEVPMRIRVQDISYSGIGGICDHKCEVGDVMFVNLSNGHEKCEFELQVRWIHYHPSGYLVGFKFIDLTKDKLLFLDIFIRNEVLNKRRRNITQ